MYLIVSHFNFNTDTQFLQPIAKEFSCKKTSPRTAETFLREPPYLFCFKSVCLLYDFIFIKPPRKSYSSSDCSEFLFLSSVILSRILFCAVVTAFLAFCELVIISAPPSIPRAKPKQNLLSILPLCRIFSLYFRFPAISVCVNFYLLCNVFTAFWRGKTLFLQIS